MSIVLTETIHQGAYIVSEAHGFQSRDTGLMSNAASIVSGTVLGLPGNPGGETATVVAAPDNTGNGVLTMDGTAPIAASAVDGLYTVEFLTATTFHVEAPNGKVLGKGTVGQTYAGPVKFVLAAGGTAFVPGDRISITVLRPAGTGDAPAPLDPSGSVEAAGVLFTHVKAASPAGTQQVVFHARNCEVRASDLTWPAGFTAPQIAEATLQLKRKGVILR